MISSINYVPIYEINGTEVSRSPKSAPIIQVESHWNEPEKVVLVIEGKKFAVLGRDLSAAINNAQNTVRH